MSVGLDIGSKTIKIVELVKEGQNWKLHASGVVGYSGNPPERMKDDKEAAALADVVRKLHREAKISTKEMIIALPEPQVFMRTINFPLLTDAEVASAVKWEAEQYIPIPAADAVVQHQILERRENAARPEVLVLLVAAPKKLVEKYVSVVQMAGLTVKAVETELMALTRAIAPHDQTVLIIDFGAVSTDIAIARNAQLYFSRSIPTAGEAFTRAVASSLGVEYKQAEEYKRTYGLSGKRLEGKIKSALEPVFRMVVDEMKKASHYYESEAEGDKPKSVILTGGTAGMPEAVSLITRMLGLEAIVGNPFEKVIVDPESEKALSGYAPLYSVAVGLAMRGE
jgi:type IV pilus assembly protein PilM